MRLLRPTMCLSVTAVLLSFAVGGCPGSGGTGNGNANDGTDGSIGPAGPTGPQGPAGDPGPTGPAGPVDSTVPAAPTTLWIVGSEKAVPPNYELRWLPGDSSVAIQYFKVYESENAITAASDSLLSATVPGPADRVVLPIFVGSGVRYFRVAAVSYTGVEGPLSPVFAVDTTARVAFNADLVIDGQFNLFVGAPGATPTPVSGTFVAGGTILDKLWSPTARHMAYVAEADTPGIQELYVSPTDGSATRLKVSGPLVSGGQVSNFSFAWSPDATRLFYLADQNMDDVMELFVTPADGSSAPIAISGALVTGGDVQGAYWSPDGRHVAFIGDKDLDSTNGIYVAPADGSSAPVRVSGPPDAAIFTGFGGNSVWSPDSKFVLFTTYSPGSMSGDLLAAAADGSGAITLTGAYTTSLGSTAWWAPDGARVAFTADYFNIGKVELFVVPGDGSGPPVKVSGEMVTGGTIANTGFNPWSPDGTKLAFVADKLVDNKLQIFVADSGGGAEPILVSDPALATANYPQWSPDGQHIGYFTSINQIRVTDGRSSDSVNIVGTLVGGGALWGSCCFAWNGTSSGMYFMADKLIDEKLEVFLGGLTDDNEPSIASGAAAPATADSFSGTSDASPIGYRPN